MSETTKAQNFAGSEASAAEAATAAATVVAAAITDADADADAGVATSASSDTVARDLESSTDAKDNNEPLCLECATPDAVPLHLRHLLSQLSDRKNCSSVELLMLVIYTVALESGFVEQEAYVEKREQLKPVPTVGCFHIYNVLLLSQKSPQSLRIQDNVPIRMVLRTVFDESVEVREAIMEKKLQSHLMAVVLGDLLMVTLSPAPPSKEPGFSICLPIGRFVLNVQLQPLYKRFHKLDELSLSLKQKLFHPMRSQQLLALNFYLHPSLLGLPAELYSEIFRYLNENQLNILANVSKQLNRCIKEFKEFKQLKMLQ